MSQIPPAKILMSVCTDSRIKSKESSKISRWPNKIRHLSMKPRSLPWRISLIKLWTKQKSNSTRSLTIKFTKLIHISQRIESIRRMLSDRSVFNSRRDKDSLLIGSIKSNNTEKIKLRCLINWLKTRLNQLRPTSTLSPRITLNQFHTSRNVSRVICLNFKVKSIKRISIEKFASKSYSSMFKVKLESLNRLCQKYQMLD